MADTPIFPFSRRLLAPAMLTYRSIGSASRGFVGRAKTKISEVSSYEQ